MLRPSLRGRSILVVEDEPLIVMDISLAFESSGAQLTTTNTLKHAALLVEHDGLAAAIIDNALPDGDSSSLCARLKERGIPFMFYSGSKIVEGPWKDEMQVLKPSTHEMLLDAMEELIRGSKISD